MILSVHAAITGGGGAAQISSRRSRVQTPCQISYFTELKSSVDMDERKLNLRYGHVSNILHIESSHSLTQVARV